MIRYFSLLAGIGLLLTQTSCGQQTNTASAPTAPAAPSAPAAAGVAGPEETLTARGNEPGWRLDIGPDQTVLLMNNGTTRSTAGGAVAETAGGARTYRVAMDGQPLIATFVEQPCADSMSGMPHPYTVTVVFGGQELRGCGGNPADLLLGAAWVVAAIDDSAIVGQARGTIQFLADGSVSGRSFCNNYRGNYTLTGESLTISLLASTLMGCAPEIMDQEKRFTDVLMGVQGFEHSADGTLILRGTAGSIAARRE